MNTSGEGDQASQSVIKKIGEELRKRRALQRKLLKVKKKKEEEEMKVRVAMMNKKIVEIETEKRLLVGEKIRLVETMNKVGISLFYLSF